MTSNVGKYLRWICALLLLAGGWKSATLQAQSQASRYRVGALEIIGNRAFEEDRLKQLVAMRPRAFPISLFSSTRFYRDVFEGDLQNLRDFYRNRGYLQAAIADTQIAFDRQAEKVRLRVELAEGPLTRIEDINILGNRSFSDSLLRQKLPFQSGDAFQRILLNDAELNIISHYARHGYLETEVLAEVAIDTVRHRASIDFILTENVQFTIGEIHIKGLNTTDTSVVRRELLFRTGEVIDYQTLLKSQRRLYLTSLFPSVFIRPRSSSQDSTSKDILVELREREYGELSLFAGYGSIEKASGSAEILHHNLWGSARKAGIKTDLSFVLRRLEVSYSQPWTWGWRVRTDLLGFYKFEENPGFDVASFGGRLTLGRKFGERSDVLLSYQYENLKLRNVKSRQPRVKEKNNLRTVSLSLIYDSRDNIFNSTRGVYLQLKSDLTGTIFQGSDTFFKSTLTTKYFYPFTASTVLATAVEIGWMEQFASDEEIPLSKRFFAGGPSDLRGFDLQEVGPLDLNRNPLGGTLKFTWNALEIRQALYKWFGMVGFVDIGNVWAESGQFRPGDIRISPGIGARVNTPLGLVRLDYGFNIDPRPRESGGSFYFSMGQAF